MSTALTAIQSAHQTVVLQSKGDPEMAKREMFYNFRGKEIRISYDISIEYDTIMGEWWFTDLNRLKIKRLKVSPQEDGEILDACVSDMESTGASVGDDD